ncbi:MAG: PhoH family protein [bacterium]
MSELHSVNVTLEPHDNQRLANLGGQFDEHLRQIERGMGIEINNRGADFNVIGSAQACGVAVELLRDLYQLTNTEVLVPAKVHLFLQQSGIDERIARKGAVDDVVVRTRRGQIKARGLNQADYLRNIQSHDLAFGIGPAGTGKTYLAVARAVEALENEEVRRLVLVRPAVEAGERLGFLPGDLTQKIDPYLRPMYDALYEMLGFEKVAKLMEKNVIEVAPLAYMRGRTLNESFIILDEAQNTTVEQMKMFLTRIGFGSTAVVNGDVTQTDLPSVGKSGLRHVIKVLKGVDGVSFNFFTARDVVRHPLVRRIVEAYEKEEEPHG